MYLGAVSNSELLSRITVDPEICHGKPCVRGLRYPVEFLLELLSGDMTLEEILADYPDLEADDLKAACAYGSNLSAWRTHDTVSERAKRGTWEKFDRAMGKVRDVPPLPGDEK